MSNYPTVGQVQRLDPRLDNLLAPDAAIERLTHGLTWSEGPIWVREGAYLLFSDIPRNAILRWSAREGTSIWMQPSGYTGVAWYGDEPGSNGMTLDAAGRLTACEHGDRRVSRLEPRGGKFTLADSYNGKRLNSPNDLVYRSNGDLYFTDPAYGLPGRYEDTENRELDFCGVYLRRTNGEVVLLTDELTHPNGIALSPDESILYVSQSNPDRAIWMAYDVQPDGTVMRGRVLADVTADAANMVGLPDGFKLDVDGNLWATGPGGVLVITPSGEILGRIETTMQTANCAWGDDGSTLYMTAHKWLCRIRTRTKGAGW